MDINGSTKIAAIFGNPIDHTLSPAMHNAAFRALGYNSCYIPFKVTPEDLPAAVSSIRSLNLMGVNTTVPHKEKVIPLLDEIDDEASFIGAVNTITNTEGTLKGYNTDGRGFMSSLDEAGIKIDGKDILIIGAGGASRAVSYYLSEKASGLSLFDIDKDKAGKLITDLKKIRDNVSLVENIDEPARFEIIINATPLGLGSGDPLPVPPGLIADNMVICDLIYKKTRLLETAEKAGAKTLDGSGMLLWQGVLAFELWTGTRPPVEIMRKALISGMAD